MNTDNDFKSSEEVVYIDLKDELTVYRYGRLVRCLGDNVWELEDTPTSTRCLRTNQIISLKAPIMPSNLPGLL